MRSIIYRTDDGDALRPQLGSVRWELELAADVELREERLLGTLWVYREELAHSLDTALRLGRLRPVNPTGEQVPNAEPPHRSLLSTLMGVRPTASA